MRLDDAEKDAWKRLLSSKDGALAVQSLRNMVGEIGPNDTCALHQHTGMRILARQLLNIFEEKAEDGYNSNRNAKSRTKSRRHPA